MRYLQSRTASGVQGSVVYCYLIITVLNQSLRAFFDNMRYLCVLDLSETSITSLPDSIGNLSLLKYLNLSRTKIKKLPESLSGLRHLQFLDVKYTPVTRLHSGIDKHKYMLHLNLGMEIDSCPVGISKLIYLHTLIGVSFSLGNAASANALQLGGLKGLRDLDHLSLIFKGSNSSGDPQLISQESNSSGDLQLADQGTFRGMTKMRILYVRYHGSGGSLHLPTDMEAMERLEIVYLWRCAVPKWIFQLQNLMELTLSGMQIASSADFRGLEKIPNLKKLEFAWSQNLNLNFIEFPNEFGEAGAFLKLEELVLNFFKLKSIPSFHEDAMPRLRCLRMKGGQLVENMPEGLTKLKNLKEVEVEMRVDSLENFEYGKRHCWQSLKDRQIKIKVEVYDGTLKNVRVM